MKRSLHAVAQTCPPVDMGQRRRTYIDLKGRKILLSKLDEPERQLVARLRKRVSSCPDWNDFESFWNRVVAEFYGERGLTPRQWCQNRVARIAEDLSERLAIASGKAHRADYIDELRQIIWTRFKTIRAFCQATGLAEDMVSHVLARRKHLALDTLLEALHRIGYDVRIVSSRGEQP